MDCQELDRKEIAEKYVSGQLDPALQDEFETHILECPRCLQTLEVLQNVRDDLADRAQLIRAQSSVQRVRFRWQWLAAVPLLAIVAVVGFFRVWHASPSAPPSQTALNSPPVSEVQKDSQASGLHGGSARSDSTAVPPAASTETKPDKIQVNTKSLPPASGQTSAPATTPGFSQQAVPPAQSVEVKTTEIASAPPGAGTTDKIVTAPTSTKSPPPETEEVAKERFRLGIVQPPPYTFSGFASTKVPGRNSKSGMGKALGAPGGKPGQPNSSDIARSLFQNAMDAYLEQRYGAAASLLEDAAQVQPKADEINFFLGICRLMLAKPADAVAPLQNVVADEKSTYAQSAHYYLAKAYVQTGNLAEAEAQLQAAAAMPGKLRSQAGSMLGRVQALRTTQGNQGPLQPKP